MLDLSSSYQRSHSARSPSNSKPSACKDCCLRGCMHERHSVTPRPAQSAASSLILAQTLCRHSEFAPRSQVHNTTCTGDGSAQLYQQRQLIYQNRRKGQQQSMHSPVWQQHAGCMVAALLGGPARQLSIVAAPEAHVRVAVQGHIIAELARSPRPLAIAVAHQAEAPGAAPGLVALGLLKRQMQSSQCNNSSRSPHAGQACSTQQHLGATKTEHQNWHDVSCICAVRG